MKTKAKKLEANNSSALANKETFEPKFSDLVS